MKKLYCKMGAAITVGAYALEANPAFATETGFQGIVTSLRTSVRTIPQLLAVLAYLAGIAFVVAGIFKLKSHVENPGNNRLQDAVIRLGAGGALLVAPTVIAAATGSIGDGNEAISMPEFGNI